MNEADYAAMPTGAVSAAQLWKLAGKNPHNRLTEMLTRLVNGDPANDVREMKLSVASS